MTSSIMLGHSWIFLLLCSSVAPQETPDGYSIVKAQDGFSISILGKVVFSHSKSSPAIFLGNGETNFQEMEGNFFVKDYTSERIGLVDVDFEEDGIEFSRDDDIKLKITLESDENNLLTIRLVEFPQNYNRLWLRLKADDFDTEFVYGGGEQYSYFNLRGKDFPIWTREQGVGRNIDNPIKHLVDGFANGKGGEYHTTYHPQPTFVSSRKYYCHVEGSNYINLDFKHPEYHEIYILGKPEAIHFNADNSMKGLIQKLTKFLHRQPPLPDWVHEGAILGIQGGTDKMLEYLTKAQINDIPVRGLWIQDWSGKRFTSFGKRVFWDWKWNPKQYPDLDEIIKKLKAEEVRVLVYINPNLDSEGELFKYGDEKGYFMKNSKGETYLQDFGEYFCGTVDFTNPEAYEWYKGVIKTNLIDLGLGGWMADFSEYIPVDGVFYDGTPGVMMHNKYPVLWAKVNREAIEESNKVGEVVFFMRAGGAGTSQYSTLMWAGDQNVDFSYGDGLPTVIPAALSHAMSGIGFTHFDIGCYTTVDRQVQVPGYLNINLTMVRSKELLLRGAEMAVFTPVMRTHEGNIPSVNHQVFSDDSTMVKFSRLVKMFKALTPYWKRVELEYSEGGLPAQRPLFLHYDGDKTSYTVNYQYLFGEDLLVAPVVDTGVDTWKVYFPPGTWVYLYDGKEFRGPKQETVPAPLGKPPVFYKKNSKFVDVFKKVALVANQETGYCDSVEGKCP